MKVFLSIILLFNSCFLLAENTKKIDSLLVELDKLQEVDTNLMNTHNWLSFEFREYDIDKAEYHAQKALEIARQLNSPVGMIHAYHNAASTYYHIAEFDTCIELNLMAAELAKEAGLDKMEARSYINTAVYYDNFGDLKQAIDYALMSLKINEKIHDLYGMAAVYNEMGSIYFQQDMFEEAILHFRKAMELDEKNKDLSGLSYDYGNIGTSYRYLDKLDSSLYFIKKCVDLRRKLNQHYSLSIVLSNLANVYMLLGKLDSAQISYKEAIYIAEEQNNRDALCHLNSSMSKLYMDHFGDPKEALVYAEKSLELAREIKSLSREMEAAGALASIYDQIGDFENAYKMLRKQVNLEDTINNQKNSEMLASLERKYETEKKELQITNLKQERQLQNERNTRKNILIFSTLGILVILGVLIYIVYTRLKLTRLQKSVIESQHREIQHSINYAKRIQNALLTTDEYWDDISKNHFIFFKPRDVVSGDFFWAYCTEDDLAIWVAADCTGHGVPGAFMSMLGVGFLSEIVVEAGITEANKILDRLRDKIIKSLRRKNVDAERYDGMDIAICIWDKKTNKLQYAGAYNPLIHISDGKLEMIRADRQPIGRTKEIDKPFTAHEIQLKKGDMLYTFSDGYIDQFGGPNDKKFGSKQFKELLLKMSSGDIASQEKELQKTFSQWKGKSEQLDDICIVGVRV